MTTQKPKSKPVAVLISDVHYSLSTLQLADTAFRMAIDHAAMLGVTLVDCGDLTNDKAVLRGEVVNALISTSKYAAEKGVEVTCIVGNHSLLNEKHSAHAIEFLRPFWYIVDEPWYGGKMTCIPYQSTPEAFSEALNHSDNSRIILIHQGVKGGSAGHYIQDHSAVDLATLEGYRSIGGHYHNHHTIGNHTFVGNPYTLTFGEHADGPKGFCVLYDDGSLEQIPTNLRKHIKVERNWDDLTPVLNYKAGDLVWVKVTGPAMELDKLDKATLCKKLCIDTSFKLDLVPVDAPKLQSDISDYKNHAEILDQLIAASAESAENKAAIVRTYKELMK